jgi:hypothetical protein
LIVHLIAMSCRTNREFKFVLFHSLNFDVQFGQLDLVDDPDGVAELGDDAGADCDLVLPQSELLPSQYRHRRRKGQTDCRLK